MQKLNKGDKAPAFELLNQNEDVIKLSDYLGKKLLIFFYPKANTPGCTTQSCSVSEAREDFSSKNVEVLGISPDMSDKQKKFDDKYTLGFNLLSDPEHKIAEAFSVWGEKKMYGKSYMGIIRSMFLIDEHGKIIEAFYKISPKDTIPKAKKSL